MFNPMGNTNPQDLGNGGTLDGDVTITGDLTVDTNTLFVSRYLAEKICSNSKSKSSTRSSTLLYVIVLLNSEKEELA